MNVIRALIIDVGRYGQARTIVVDEHLSAMSDEPRWLPLADVIVCLGTWPYGSSETALGETLIRHPGCLIVARSHAGGRCTVAIRDGQIASFAQPDPWIMASAAHAWTVGGRRLAELGATSIRMWRKYSRPAGPGAVEPVLLEVRRVR